MRAGDRQPPVFEARNSATRLLLLAAGSATLVIAGLWLVGVFGQGAPASGLATIVGWAAILFFGLCAAVNLLRLRDGRVALRVDADGIWWKQWSDDVIRWSDISGIGVVTIRRQKMLGLSLREGATPTRSAFLARLARANEALVGYPLCIATTGTDRSFADLLAAVEHYRPVAADPTA